MSTDEVRACLRQDPFAGGQPGPADSGLAGELAGRGRRPRRENQVKPHRVVGRWPGRRSAAQILGVTKRLPATTASCHTARSNHITTSLHIGDVPRRHDPDQCV